MLEAVNLTEDNKRQIEILDRKLSAKLKNGQMNIQTALKKMEEQDSFLNDYIADPSLIDFRINNGILQAAFNSQEFQLHNNAVHQLAEKFGIPTSYLKDLSTGNEWEMCLSQHILNEHKDNAHQEALLLRAVNNELRGVLSNKFDRYSSMEVYKSFLKGAQYYDNTVICDAHYNDLTGYIEIIDKTIRPLRLKDNELTYVVMGAQIRNSDFGCSALDVKIFFMQVVCMNGMTGQSMVRKVHRSNAVKCVNVQLTRETLEADSKAKSLYVRDCMSSAFNSIAIQEEIAKLEKAAGYEIDLVKEVKLLPKLGIHKSEIQSLEGKFMENNPEDGLTGGNTLWKLAQGISAVANDLGDVTRKRDLQDIAGSLFNRVN